MPEIHFSNHPLTPSRNQVFKPRAATKIFLCLSLLFALFSCVRGKVDPVDRETGLGRSEIESALLKNPKGAKSKKAEKSDKVQVEAPIPTVSKLIITPPPPVIGGEKIISFSVTEDVLLKDVLIELGRVARIDIDIDPSISGGIILNAKNRPFKEVIDRISNLGNLRYSYRNGVLHFERDTPYMKNYFVDYLTDGTLWADVENNIKAILDSEQRDEVSKSSAFLNKSAGIIAVFATEKQHNAITGYLKDVEKYASAQVLIEAKVVEVTLSDTYKTGIDWTKVGNNTTITAINGYSAPAPGGTAIGIVTGEWFNSDLSSSISALEKFGLAKAISSPRIHAINNQKATLEFVDKLVYFKVDSTSSTATGTSTSQVSTVTSTKLEENTGVELEIMPSVNVRTNEIIMNIKPKLTVKSGEVVDPASPRDQDGNVIEELKNIVPIIQTRQLSTIAKIQSGNVIVIGGLMKETGANSDSGIPLVSRIPVLGWLFKSVSKQSDIVETVIFIKATIVNSGSPAHKVDRDIQEKFDPNRRVFFE